MAVIPFDPHRARSDSLHSAITTEPLRDVPADAASTDDGAELEQALHRTHALERLLVATLRQNAVNWARAEYASILLASRG